MTLIVTSAVGGTFELMELGVSFHPGETIDLSFYATSQQLDKSKELQCALERGHLQATNSTPSVPVNFCAFTCDAAPIGSLDESSVRTALFVDVSIPQESASYNFYVMRDLFTRRNIVTSTQDRELLKSIIANEQDVAIVATARGRLNRLYQTEGGEEECF